MTSAPTIDGLRDARGRFSMLAIDQRESLRQMLSRGTEAPVGDDALVDFKVAVVETLAPAASAVLVDRQYGERAARAAACPVILAADILSQSVPGGAVDRAELDEELTEEVALRLRAAALKMLVPWTPDRRDEAGELTDRFMSLCRALGLPGIVEGVVRPVDISAWSDRDRDYALVQAARDLAAHRPDLYKAEIPSYGRGDGETITAAARAITESLDCPWVVLSSGVTADLFPRAVALCAAGGAQGFLAGRAIWADAIAAPDPEEFLRVESRRRLETLAAGGEA